MATMNEFESSVLKDSPSEFPSPISGSKASGDGIISHDPKLSPSPKSLPESSAATFGSDEYLIGSERSLPENSVATVNDAELLPFETMLSETNLPAVVDDSFLLECETIVPESDLALIDEYLIGSDSSLPESSVAALGVDPGMVFDDAGDVYLSYEAWKTKYLPQLMYNWKLKCLQKSKELGRPWP